MVRATLALILSLLLALASVGAAAARGPALPGMAVEICGADGAVLILDPDGNPAKPRVTCPDCTAALGPALMRAPVALPQALPPATARGPAAAPRMPARPPSLRPEARAPPPSA